MRTGALAIAALVCLGLTMAVPAEGQDFEQLLQAVDKLEANLQARLEKESRQRQQAVEELRAEIAQARKGSVDSGELDRLTEGLARLKAERSQPIDSEWQKSIEKQVAELRKRIDELAGQQQNPIPDISQEELAQLTADIAWLKAENTRLQEMIEGSHQYVSTDEMAIPQADRQQVNELTRRLTNLNEQLEKMVAQDDAQPSPAKSDGFLGGLALNGFVDASNYSDFNTSENSFGLDQVEVDISQEFSSRARVQADIEYVSDGQGGFDLDLEQGYFTYSAGSAQPWHFSFGRFNAPIGFEGVDPPDMYQYSGGLVGSYCVPGNLTGLLVTTEFGSTFDWAVYAVNGWDVNTDNNQDKTVGSRLGISPFANFSFGLSAISGPERDNNNSSRRTVFDLDLTYNLTESWLWGGEFNYGTETNVLAAGGDADWTGFLIMTNIGFAERWGVTGRFDYLSDNDGVLTGQAQDWKAVTLSPSVALTDALGGLVEFRYDFSNQQTFASDDGMKDNQFTTAVEFIYTF
jgi:hypothetical protein